MKNLGSILIVPFFLFALSGQVFGQQVLIDQGVRVEGLWCFPSYSDTLSWLFLPDEARLALDDALVWISERYGSQLEALRWVDAHQATQNHPVDLSTLRLHLAARHIQNPY